MTSAPSVLAGAPVTYTVRVTAPTGSPVPTGVVTVRDGTTPIGTCPLASGSCTVISSALAVGTHAITASYPGDAAHDPSTSVEVLQVVASGIRASRAAATTNSSGQTSLVASLPVGATTGDVLVAAVTVTGGTGTTITASGWTKLTGSDISSGTLLRQGLYYRVRAAADPSTFTFTFSSAQKASAVIVAVAGADTTSAPRSAAAAFASATAFTLPSLTFGGSRLTGVALGFLGVGVGTTLSAVANGYTTTASIAATGGKTATQTTSAAAQLALADATGATGARITMAAAGVGLGQTVFVPAASATTVTRILTGPAAATFGTASTWTARVDPTTATGSVAFLVDGVASGITCPIVAGTCSGSLALPAGPRTVSARFVPTPTSLLASTSTPVAVTVARATSTTTLTLLSPTTIRGGVASFRVAVAGGLTPAAGTGIVRVLENGLEIASCTLAAGLCDATTATLAVGPHVVSAAFDGDTNLEASSSLSATQTVTRAASTTSLVVSPTSAPYGSAITLTATVASTAATPTGTISFSDGILPLASCTLGDGGTPGTCTATVRSLSIGDHALIARYGGDGNLLESSSGSRTTTVVKATSALAVSSGPAAPTLGTTVTFTASVTTGDGSVATGTVTFTEGTSVLGSCTLGTGGTAGACSISLSTLGVGDHLIGVGYGGDGVHQATSVTTTQAIGRAPTTTSILTSANPATYGSLVTFTVSVTSGAGTPTGRVALTDGTTPLGFCDLSGGSCTIRVGGLAVGPHTLVATYAGDATRASSSVGLAQSIIRASTATTLAVSGTLTFGATVTLTATVDRPGATGTVTFTDGTTPIGSCVLGSGGTAGRCSIDTSTLPTGARSIVASYLGDTNFTASASTAATPTIARATTNLALGRSGSTVYGSTVVLTATLDRTTASGTVSFSDGTTGIGTCTLGTLAPGACAISTAGLAVGAHAVTARYAGDASFQPATSLAVSFSIVRGPSSTAVAASAPGGLVGDPFTFSVTVTPSTATGLADVFDGGTWLGQCQLVGGACTVTTSFATRGSKAIVASYQGDTNVDPSVSPGIVVIVRSPSTTSLATDVTTSTYGGSVSLTATVAGADGGTPTGRIAFSDGTTGIGSCDLAGGTSCSIAVSSLSAGLRSLVARFDGDAGYGPSSGTASVRVFEATSSTSVTTSAPSVVALTSVTFSVSVTTGDGGPATGFVAVSDGTTPISTCRLSGGACTVSTDLLTVGAHTVVATYLGDLNHTGSSGSVAQTITAIPTTLTAAASPASATWGATVTLSATVVPGAATGSVAFSESNANYGSCSILASAPGGCSLTTSALTVGSHTITVRYGGDTRYGPSSTTVTVVVAKAPTTTSVATSAATSGFGSLVLFTATVSPATSTGTVNFLDGTAGIGSCTLTASSNGVCSLGSSTLAVGTHAIVARYLGSTTMQESTSGTLTQEIQPATTTLTLTPSANPSTAGGGTLTVSISPSAATGTVTVTDNGSAFTSCVLSAGTCTIPLRALALGTHALAASYPGATSYGPSSASLTQVVSIGYRAVATASSGSQTPTSLGVVIPASATAGDILVAAVTTGSATTVITAAPGWTRLGSDLTSGSLTQGLFARVATTGDIGATASFGFSAGVKASIVLVAVGGSTASLPTTFAAQANVAATQIGTPALTLATGTRGIALIFGGIATSTTVSSVGSGFTFPDTGSASTSGGTKGVTTTAAAYSAVGTYGSIGTSQITTAATTGATNVGAAVFLAQGVTP